MSKTSTFRFGYRIGMCAFGAGFSLLAVDRFRDAGEHGSGAAIPAGILALNLLAGALMVCRSRSRSSIRARSVVAALPSIALGGVVFATARGDAVWSEVLVGIFIVGAALAATSLTTLGRAFGILPAYRGLVTVGTYRWVRHPAYLGELVMAFAAVLAVLCGDASVASGAGLLAVFACLVGTVAWRIREEERLMAADHAWRSYVAATCYRLLPGVW